MRNFPPPTTEFINSVFGKDLADQIRTIHLQDFELAKEFALEAVYFLATGGEYKSDNFMINALLGGSRSFVKQNAEKYRDKRESKAEDEIGKKKLREIAALLNKGYKQVEISRELGIATSTLSDRIKTIKNKYGYLLSKSSEFQSLTKSDSRIEHNVEKQLSNPPKEDLSELSDKRTMSENSNRISNDFRMKDSKAQYDLIQSDINHSDKLSKSSGLSENSFVRGNININNNINKNINKVLPAEENRMSSEKSQCILANQNPVLSLAGDFPGQTSENTVVKNPGARGSYDNEEFYNDLFDGVERQLSFQGKTLKQIEAQDNLTEEEAKYLIENTLLPLWRRGNVIYSETEDKVRTVEKTTDVH